MDLSLRQPWKLTISLENKKNTRRLRRKKAYFQHNSTISRLPELEETREIDKNKSFVEKKTQEISLNHRETRLLSLNSLSKPHSLSPFSHSTSFSTPKHRPGPYFPSKKSHFSSMKRIDDLISHIKSSSKLQGLETQALLRDFESMRGVLRGKAGVRREETVWM